MLIDTTAGELRLALDKVKPAIEPRQTIPILGCVLLADGGVTANDLNHEIMVKFAARRFDGRVAIPFRPLSRLVRALPPDTDIRLQDAERAKGRENSDYGVYVTFSGGRYWLPSQAAEDFPEITPAGTWIKCKAPENFLQALDACRSFISTEETRYYLNGICFSKSPEGDDVVVATDGHRLIVHQLAHGIEGNLILPRVILPSLLGLPVPTQIYRTDTRLEFRMPGARLRTKLIDGTFPDWTRVLPQIPSEAPEICFTPRKMRAVLNRMQIGLSRNGQVIDICADSTGQTVVITAKTQDDEECSERLDGATAAYWSKMDNGIVSINSRYLKEICRTHIQSEEVTLTAADNRSPIQIVPNAYKALTVLMPVRGGNGLRNEALMALSPASNAPASDQKEVA